MRLTSLSAPAACAQRACAKAEYARPRSQRPRPEQGPLPAVMGPGLQGVQLHHQGELETERVTPTLSPRPCHHPTRTPVSGPRDESD
ncbi:hypothetical protein NDU88_000119 [Pleurodeles waltl]|uniref:Uncharacterized protein n=1 Tax=Pleurodeles waltl TaxID=8319 RepID=A0AAV7NZX6_PLEWA|nr:hypothetical protein NDU88_000119 [Pleurodeles waltl]